MPMLLVYSMLRRVAVWPCGQHARMGCPRMRGACWCRGMGPAAVLGHTYMPTCSLRAGAASRARRSRAADVGNPTLEARLPLCQGLHQTLDRLCVAVLLAPHAVVPCVRKACELGGCRWPQTPLRLALLCDVAKAGLPSTIQAVGHSSQGSCLLLECAGACPRSGDRRGHDRGWRARRRVLAGASAKQVALQQQRDPVSGAFVSGACVQQLVGGSCAGGPCTPPPQPRAACVNPKYPDAAPCTVPGFRALRTQSPAPSLGPGHLVLQPLALQLAPFPACLGCQRPMPTSKVPLTGTMSHVSMGAREPGSAAAVGGFAAAVGGVPKSWTCVLAAGLDAPVRQGRSGDVWLRVSTVRSGCSIASRA